MELKDRIKRFQTYALTYSTGLYNEDSQTAQTLMIQSGEKLVECMLTISDLAEAIENIQKFLKMEYAEESEELVMSIEERVFALKEHINGSFINVYNEDSMTNGEQAGCIAKAVNECLKAVNMLSDLVLDISDNVITYDLDSQMLVVGGDKNA